MKREDAVKEVSATFDREIAMLLDAGHDADDYVFLFEKSGFAVKFDGAGRPGACGLIFADAVSKNDRRRVVNGAGEVAVVVHRAVAAVKGIARAMDAKEKCLAAVNSPEWQAAQDREALKVNVA